MRLNSKVLYVREFVDGRGRTSRVATLSNGSAIPGVGKRLKAGDRVTVEVKRHGAR